MLTGLIALMQQRRPARTDALDIAGLAWLGGARVGMIDKINCAKHIPDEGRRGEGKECMRILNRLLGVGQTSASQVLPPPAPSGKKYGELMFSEGMGANTRDITCARSGVRFGTCRPPPTASTTMCTLHPPSPARQPA